MANFRRRGRRCHSGCRGSKNSSSEMRAISFASQLPSDSVVPGVVSVCRDFTITVVDEQDCFL